VKGTSKDNRIMADILHQLNLPDQIIESLVQV
jgi:hypothetical protein